jgi:hypothetical protein
VQTSLRIVFIAFAAGVVVGLAIRNGSTRAPSPESAPSALSEDAGNAPSAGLAGIAPAAIDSGAAMAPDAPVAMSGLPASSESTGTSNTSRERAAHQQPIPRATLTDEIKARPAPLAGLLNASTLGCDIDVAHGANWSQGKATLHGINYQGGPFSLESINLDAETATMSGGSGVTGTLSGELEMRTTAGNKGLTFSAFSGHGNLLIVTVYPALDSTGRYRAVMTTFGDQYDHETAQFFGACGITLTQR